MSIEEKERLLASENEPSRNRVVCMVSLKQLY